MFALALSRRISWAQGLTRALRCVLSLSLGVSALKSQLARPAAVHSRVRLITKAGPRVLGGHMFGRRDLASGDLLDEAHS